MTGRFVSLLALALAASACGKEKEPALSESTDPTETDITPPSRPYETDYPAPLETGDAGDEG